MSPQKSILANYEAVKRWILAEKRILFKNFQQFSDSMSVTISYCVLYSCIVKPKSCSDKLRTLADIVTRMPQRKFFVATGILVFDFELFIGVLFTSISYINGNITGVIMDSLQSG